MPSLVREGEIFAGKYRVERILGEGGHGLVFAAQNLALGELVAVKLLKRASADDTTAARFLREARAAQKIRGDGIARVFAVDQLDDGDLYMVMEYLEGSDLRKEIGASGKLAISDAVDSVLQACDVLGRAHAMGIIHRDVKPANLFSVKRSDGRRQIKVLDFGIARSLDPVEVSLTRSPQMMGSPLYMAPEQIVDGRSVDQRADIWGLGATLFELLAGIPPFGGGTLLQVLRRVQEHPPDDLRLLRPAVPEALERVVLRCLEKDPSRRFPDVGSLAAALGEHRVAEEEPSSGASVGLMGGARDDDPTESSARSSGFGPAAWERAPVAGAPGFSGAEMLASTVISAAAPVRAVSRPSFPPPPSPFPFVTAPVSRAPASSTPLILALGAGLTVLVVVAFVALWRRGSAAGDSDTRSASETSSLATAQAAISDPAPPPSLAPAQLPVAGQAPPATPPAPAPSASGAETPAVAGPTAVRPRATTAPRGHGSRVGSSVKTGTPGPSSVPGLAPMPDDRQ
jgi:eukaryotic-like serine/threonine-protein kinase